MFKGQNHSHTFVGHTILDNLTYVVDFMITKAVGNVITYQFNFLNSIIIEQNYTHSRFKTEFFV